MGDVLPKDLLCEEELPSLPEEEHDYLLDPIIEEALEEIFSEIDLDEG